MKIVNKKLELHGSRNVTYCSKFFYSKSPSDKTWKFGNILKGFLVWKANLEFIRLNRASIALIMEAVTTAETSANFYKAVRRSTPEDSHLQCSLLITTQQLAGVTRHELNNFVELLSVNNCFVWASLGQPASDSDLVRPTANGQNYR
jgi:hypothetical protein